MKVLHRKIIEYLIIKFMIIFLIVIYGCCSTSKEISSYDIAETLAVKKFGSSYEIVKNESDTFILYYKNDERKNHPHKLVEYFVYDLKRKEIIFEEKLFDADIEWIDDQNIEIRINPEVISDDEANVFILNVLTKQKSKSNF